MHQGKRSEKADPEAAYYMGRHYSLQKMKAHKISLPKDLSHKHPLVHEALRKREHLTVDTAQTPRSKGGYSKEHQRGVELNRHHLPYLSRVKPVH